MYITAGLYAWQKNTAQRASTRSRPLPKAVAISSRAFPSLRLQPCGFVPAARQQSPGTWLPLGPIPPLTISRMASRRMGHSCARQSHSAYSTDSCRRRGQAHRH